MGVNANTISKPDLRKRLFWEFDYDNMDWQDGYVAVIERVLDRGTEEEWKELIRFYGRAKVLETARNGNIFLADHAIEKVCAYFSLHKEDLLCFTKKQSRMGHWI